jgi:hypothetical protein
LASRFETSERGKEGSVNLHGTSPWHPESFDECVVAANVIHHGTCPWHEYSSLFDLLTIPA